MCGIIGFITQNNLHGEAARRKFMQQAFYVNTLRGKDSTGAFAVGSKPLFEDGTADYFKQVGPGYDFVSSKEYNNRFGKMDGLRAMIGHNRAATMGGLGVGSAHPFAEGPITLVHNGTLLQTYQLPIPMHSLDGVEVDSHVITHNLAKHSVKEVIENLDGAFALVWHDARDDSVNVVRNSQRPLHLALDRQSGTLYMASEGPMLDFLGHRLSLGLKEILYPSPGQHLKWLPDTPLDSPIIEKLPLATIGGDRWQQGWRSYSNYNNAAQNTWADTRSNKQDLTVYINNQRKEIPQILQEKLLDVGYDIEDELDFEPGTAVGNSSGNVAVEGKVEGRYPAILYDVPRPTYERYAEKVWTVRPLAVSAGPPHREDLLIVRLLRVVPPQKVVGHVPPTPSSSTLYVRGPKGILIPAREYEAKTASGCGLCGGIIKQIECDYVEWADDHTPICPQCAAME